jgi:hypothetical protein
MSMSLFAAGNLDSWNFAIQNYLPAAMSKITRTVDPVVKAALLALVGNTKLFEASNANVQFRFDDSGLPASLLATLEYKVPAFQVKDVTDEALEKDTAFMNAYLQQTQVPYNLAIDTKLGIVRVQVEVKVGYAI